jgi:hypothetical protein
MKLELIALRLRRFLFQPVASSALFMRQIG